MCADAREPGVWSSHAAAQLRIGAFKPDPAGQDTLSQWLTGLSSNARVLDAGGGTGLWKECFGNVQYYLLDQNPDMVAGAKSRWPDYPQERFVLCPGVADGARMPFEDGFFDHVQTVAVLQHNKTADQKMVLKEIRRVLRMGGTLGLFENTIDPSFNPGTEDGYSHSQANWKVLVEEAGFEVVEQTRDRHLFRAV